MNNLTAKPGDLLHIIIWEVVLIVAGQIWIRLVG